jgi:hypothetical protein
VMCKVQNWHNSERFSRIVNLIQEVAYRPDKITSILWYKVEAHNDGGLSLV